MKSILPSQAFKTLFALLLALSVSSALSSCGSHINSNSEQGLRGAGLLSVVSVDDWALQQLARFVASIPTGFGTVETEDQISVDLNNDRVINAADGSMVINLCGADLTAQEEIRQRLIEVLLRHPTGFGGLPTDGTQFLDLNHDNSINAADASIVVNLCTTPRAILQLARFVASIPTGFGPIETEDQRSVDLNDDGAVNAADGSMVINLCGADLTTQGEIRHRLLDVLLRHPTGFWGLPEDSTRFLDLNADNAINAADATLLVNLCR